VNALVAAELRKATATRSIWLLVALAAVFCAGWAAVQVLAFDATDVVAAYSMAQQGYPLVMIVGILLMAGEYRHRTATWAFLVTPRRGTVIGAKLVAGGVVGLFAGLLAALVTAPVVMVLLAAREVPVFTAKVPLALLGSVAGTALWCVFGVAVGALIRNQSAAIAVALIWTFYAEWFLIMLVPAVGRWTPTGAAKAASGWTRTDLATPGALLPMWAGALLFLAYALTAAALAGLTIRRDVA
jgi:ABC-2 type transport system permease protein